MSSSIRDRILPLVCCAGLALLTAGCGKEAKPDPAAEAPPAAQVEHVGETGLIKVEHPEQFPVATASSYSAGSELNVTGVVAADISRAVPVISLASGRIVEVHAKLGDSVTKGQLLMRVQSADISAAYSDYRQAVADLTLAKAQLERSKLLLDKGAIAAKDSEVAVDTEAKAQVTVETTQEHLRVLGADQNHPSAIVDVFAPISGVITDQQVTAAAGTQGLASPNPFTISDLSHVWVICDVFENDLKNVRLGEFADVRLNAFPERVFHGRIGNIGPILDPTMRTAKVRLEMPNPGLMRVGMFVTATFHGADKQTHALVPANAVLHLHDRDWVYEPAGNKSFKRVEVSGGKMLPENMQEILSGIAPGDRVVSNALILQNTAEQ
ncbi:MAG TPA: efflux RND transporter periplasmic adaptor subunit [Bryobacteraceae bacterium]|nr:efflux RND transporter periplasmic adaptor subunit [Bryobacteraceae bacterium]